MMWWSLQQIPFIDNEQAPATAVQASDLHPVDAPVPSSKSQQWPIKNPVNGSIVFILKKPGTFAGKSDFHLGACFSRFKPFHHEGVPTTSERSIPCPTGRVSGDKKSRYQ
jgi:hypothetical protein